MALLQTEEIAIRIKYEWQENQFLLIHKGLVGKRSTLSHSAKIQELMQGGLLGVQE